MLVKYLFTSFFSDFSSSKSIGIALAVFLFQQRVLFYLIFLKKSCVLCEPKKDKPAWRHVANTLEATITRVFVGKLK